MLMVRSNHGTRVDVNTDFPAISYFTTLFFMHHDLSTRWDARNPRTRHITEESALSRFSQIFCRNQSS